MMGLSSSHCDNRTMMVTLQQYYVTHIATLNLLFILQRLVIFVT
jgi:hypothetical protein